MRIRTAIVLLLCGGYSIEGAQLRSGKAPERTVLAGPPADAQILENGVATKVITTSTKGSEPIADVVDVSFSWEAWSTKGKRLPNLDVRNESDKRVSKVAPGLRECVKLMTVGEVRRCWIPAEIAALLGGAWKFGLSDAKLAKTSLEKSSLYKDGAVVIDVEVLWVEPSRALAEEEREAARYRQAVAAVLRDARRDTDVRSGRTKAFAEIRAAEENAYGKEVELAKLALETLELRASTPEITSLEGRINQLRSDVIGREKTLEPMTPTLALLTVILETARNLALTPEIASARSRLNTLKNLALTETLQRALDNLELIDNRQEIQNAGGSAMNADIAKILLRKEIAEEILDKALTPALAASRAQRDSLMAKAAQEDTDAARASAHVADIRSKVVTQELIDSRNRLEELRSAARAVIK